MTRRSIAVTAFLVLMGAMAVQAQDARTLSVVADGSSLSVEGTSNKSDWAVEASSLSGSFEVSGSGAELAILAARFVVASKMESPRGRIMDRLMWDALKVDEHPEIVYELISASASGDGVFATTGTLSLAGASQEIAMDVTASEAEGGLRFVGQAVIDMTEWSIKPPTALFGSLHTGKEVTVKYDVLARAGGSGEAGSEGGR